MHSRRNLFTINFDSMMSRSKRYNCIVILPILLCSVNYVTFLIWPSLFYFRSWEFFKDIGPRYDGSQFWSGPEKGDLSRPYLFLYQDKWRTTVTLNEHGYRVVPVRDADPSMLFVGDSYLRGGGLSDHQTVPWLVSELTGASVYNGSGATVPSLLAYPRLASVRLVIEVRTERGFKAMAKQRNWTDEPFQSWWKTQSGFNRLDMNPNRWNIGFRLWRSVRRLQNDLKCRKDHQGNPPEYLFEQWDIPSDPTRTIVRNLQQWQRLLKERGIAYLFIPIPSKQTIYANELKLDTSNLSLQFVDTLVPKLQLAGVHTLNLRPIFEQNKDRDIFLRTDSHWSPIGAKLAATAITKYLYDHRLLDHTNRYSSVK